tara:strand:- start:3996 stop:5351 length:1356 start_codon:yes stop_codon:yes gene_type:complete
MDLKDKIKKSGIETVKNKLESLKSRLEKQKRPEKQSKLKNSIEGALSTGKIEISKKAKDLINPDLNISNSRQKSFKTPSSDSEAKKFQEETKNSVLKSDIGKLGLGIKEDLKNRARDAVSKMLGEDISGSILKKNPNPTSTPKDGNTGTKDVFTKGKGVATTSSEMANPLMVQKLKNYEQKAIYKDLRDDRKDPGIKFKVISAESPGTEQMEKMKGLKVKKRSRGSVRQEVILPILQNELSSTYGFDYEGSEKAILGGKDGGFFDASAAIKGIGGALIGGVGSAPIVGNYIEKVAQKGLQGMGVAVNPNLEQIFKNVAFRDFSLDFILVAKSAEDAKEYQEIIKMFKYWSHPESVDGSWNGSVLPLLYYPDLWSVEYIVPDYNIGTENARPSQGGVIYRTKMAYCTKIDVSYSTGDYLLLENNEPAVIKLSLSFKEKNLLTRKDIITGDEV